MRLILCVLDLTFQKLGMVGLPGILGELRPARLRGRSGSSSGKATPSKLSVRCLESCRAWFSPFVVQSGRDLQRNQLRGRSSLCHKALTVGLNQNGCGPSSGRVEVMNGLVCKHRSANTRVGRKITQRVALNLPCVAEL